MGACAQMCFLRMQLKRRRSEEAPSTAVRQLPALVLGTTVARPRDGQPVPHRTAVETGGLPGASAAWFTVLPITRGVNDCQFLC